MESSCTHSGLGTQKLSSSAPPCSQRHTGQTQDTFVHLADRAEVLQLSQTFPLPTKAGPWVKVLPSFMTTPKHEDMKDHIFQLLLKQKAEDDAESLGKGLSLQGLHFP